MDRACPNWRTRRGGDCADASSSARPAAASVSATASSIRIFKDYIAGISPKQIAKDLNREGLRGPRGALWGPSTIHGNPKRGTGILHNELYIGCMV